MKTTGVWRISGYITGIKHHDYLYAWVRVMILDPYNISGAQTFIFSYIYGL